MSVALLGLLLIAACGGDDDRAPAATPSPSPTVATAAITVVHAELARRPPPPQVSRFRFIARSGTGEILYGPREVAREVTVELRGVPREAVTLQIDYLTAPAAAPIAVFRTSVDLTAGAAAIVDPAFVDLDDPVVFSFVSIACNRVAEDALSSNSPSSANVGQLTQDFTEIVDPEHASPTPHYVFFIGDLVLNLAAGTETLASQLQGWKALYATTPLGNSSIPLIAIAGNHELLVEITATPGPTPTPAPGEPVGKEKAIEIPNPPTGEVFTTEMSDFIPAANGPTAEPPNPDHVERDESMLSFSFRDGPNLFIVVNTETYVGGDTPDATGRVPLHWIAEQLAAADDDPGVDNVFVFGHRPVSSPDPSNAGIAPSQAAPFYELLAAPSAAGAPSKVRAYICAHAHLWDQSVPSIAPPGSTLVQVIAGNGGSPVSSVFAPAYYGYTSFAVTAAGNVTLESWGRPVPTPYAAPAPQPASTLREQLTIYAPANADEVQGSGG